MKIATKSRYGMRFMIDMAQHWGEGPQSMREVAERQGISKKYLEQVVAPLSNKGLVTVLRGHQGGYELSRPPEMITMAEIFDATEGGLNLLTCLGGDQSCNRLGACLSVNAWAGLQDAMTAYMSSKTLADLSRFPLEDQLLEAQ